jgi:hypothetical protein
MSTARELCSYLSCLSRGFAPEVFVEHGETWARYAREGRRPEVAAEIEKATAEARRECQRLSASSPKSLETSVSATTMPAPRAAPTAASPPEQAEIDDGWAAAVSRAGHARATSRPAAPTPAPARQISAAEAEANWIEIAATLNKEANAKPRKAVRG